MTSEQLAELGRTIEGALPGAVTGHAVAHGELTIHAQAADVVKVVTFLRDDPSCAFYSFIDITAIDWPSRDKRFDVVYHFLSPTRNARVRLKIETDEATPVASLTDVFAGANWFERETYDLYGVLFTGHPDLRRLLTDYGFGSPPPPPPAPAPPPPAPPPPPPPPALFSPPPRLLGCVLLLQEEARGLRQG